MDNIKFKERQLRQLSIIKIKEYTSLCNDKSISYRSVKAGTKLQWISPVLFLLFHSRDLGRSILLLSLLSGSIVIQCRWKSNPVTGPCKLSDETVISRGHIVS